MWQSLVTHTQNLCSAFNPSKSTHTVNTHPEQWAANGEQMGVRCLAQRVSSQSWYWRWRERSLFTPSTDNSCRTRDSNPQPRVTSLTLYPLGHNCPYITLSSYHRFIYIYIYIYAFSRRFYPKRLTIAFRLYIKYITKSSNISLNIIIYHKTIIIYHQIIITLNHHNISPNHYVTKLSYHRFSKSITKSSLHWITLYHQIITSPNHHITDSSKYITKSS